MSDGVGLRVISLFSGIGGLDLGVKIAWPRTRTVCYVERESFCQRILIERMRDGSLDDGDLWDDVTTFDGTEWRGRADMVIGGYPCQPWSVAGKRRGIADERWLWPDMARIIREVRPRFVFLENVAGHVVWDGLGTVLADLAAFGFAAEWGTLRASDVGASHQRRRVFVLAHARSESAIGLQPERFSECGDSTLTDFACTSVADAPSSGRRAGIGDDGTRESNAAGNGTVMGNAASTGRREGRTESTRSEWEFAAAEPGLPLFPPGPSDFREWRRILDECGDLAPALTIEKASQPYIRRMVDGSAFWVDPAGIWRPKRLKALGNAVVPLQSAVALTLLSRRLGISFSGGG